MRKNIDKVLSAFARKGSAIGDSKRTCHTDGETLYSYAMPIAKWEDGRVVVAPVDQAPSRTTKGQIRATHQAFPSAEVRSLV